MKSAKNLLKKLNGNQNLTLDEWNVIESKYFSFKIGSTIKYIGKRKIKGLKKNSTYTVSNIFFSKVDESGKVNNKWYENPIPFINLKEVDQDFSFPQNWFVEVEDMTLPKLPIELLSSLGISTNNPKKKASKKSLSINDLTIEMNNAVEREDYETAIRIRDEIKGRQ